jgi:hypothetical protein
MIQNSRPQRGWNFLHPPSLLYNGYQVPLPGVQQPGHGTDHSPHSSTILFSTFSIIPSSATNSTAEETKWQWPQQQKTAHPQHQNPVHARFIKFHISYKQHQMVQINYPMYPPVWKLFPNFPEFFNPGFYFTDFSILNYYTKLEAVRLSMRNGCHSRCSQTTIHYVAINQWQNARQANNSYVRLSVCLPISLTTVTLAKASIFSVPGSCYIRLLVWLRGWGLTMHGLCSQRTQGHKKCRHIIMSQVDFKPMTQMIRQHKCCNLCIYWNMW